jgi:hypothetical protein
MLCGFSHLTKQMAIPRGTCRKPHLRIAPDLAAAVVLTGCRSGDSMGHAALSAGRARLHVALCAALHRRTARARGRGAPLFATTSISIVPSASLKFGEALKV